MSLHRDSRRRHGAHQEQVVAERRRDVGDLAGDRVEHAVPDEIEAQRLDQRDVERRDDHKHRRVVEEHAHDQERQLHQDQHLPGRKAQVVQEQRLRSPCTAPRPSNTAPKHSAARMIHMNMQVMSSVCASCSDRRSRVSCP